MRLKLGLALALGFLLLLFTAQNTDVVTLRLLVWKLEMSRAIMIFGVGGGGFALGWLARSLRS